MELTREIANRIVDFIYSTTGYHSIVGDNTGVIIADSNQQRVGVLHKGQEEILKSNINEIIVTKEDELKTKGKTKEGLNIAIKDHDEKIGCFGVTGPVEKVKPIAKVAAGMVVNIVRDQEIKEALISLVDKLNEAIGCTVQAVEQVAASSQEEERVSRTITRSIGEALQQVKQTGNILDFIRKVAFQANFLGLNAAIEAARAGEHGEGFSVVADEVRQLADESKRSADEIEAILAQLINMIDRINQGISQNNAIIHEQTMATQDIAGIVQNVRQVGIELNSVAKIL